MPILIDCLLFREYNKEHRKDARGILVIVGNGQSQDNLKERNEAIEHLCAVSLAYSIKSFFQK